MYNYLEAEPFQISHSWTKRTGEQKARSPSILGASNGQGGLKFINHPFWMHPTVTLHSKWYWEQHTAWALLLQESAEKTFRILLCGVGDYIEQVDKLSPKASSGSFEKHHVIYQQVQQWHTECTGMRFPTLQQSPHHPPASQPLL